MPADHNSVAFRFQGRAEYMLRSSRLKKESSGPGQQVESLVGCTFVLRSFKEPVCDAWLRGLAGVTSSGCPLFTFALMRKLMDGAAHIVLDIVVLRSLVLSRFTCILIYQ
jgi:hypothetical protein